MGAGAALTVWWHAVVEALHEIRNPTSEEKIRLLGERIRPGPGSRVLDVASGRRRPALVLAAAFGCRITSVDGVPGWAIVVGRR